VSRYKGTKKEQNFFSEYKEKSGTGRFNIYINKKRGEVDREKGKIFSVIAQSYPLINNKQEETLKTLIAFRERKAIRKVLEAKIS